MAKKSKAEPDFHQKQLTSKDINLGIRKLQRRIEEVNALRTVRQDDQTADNAVSNIKVTIAEIFGEQSREMDEHKYLRIWKGPMIIGMNDRDVQRSFHEGIPDAIKILEGLISRLNEKQEDMEEDEPEQFAKLFRGLSIHSKIFHVSEKLYSDGHYANAIFEASKMLVNMVKEKVGSSEKDGAALMFSVFGGTAPKIRFNAMSSQSEQDEQSGFAQLFAGAVLALRNPRGHEQWSDSPERALEYIGFISMLAKKLDESQKSG
jgi:uncharacterized protein (TIGR02391 family)